ncbi:MAG: hypothetical protein ACYDBV_03880 [Nitrospiria bacterium]
MFLFQRNQKWFSFMVSFAVFLLIGVASSYGEERSDTEPPPLEPVAGKENIFEKFQKGFVSSEVPYSKAPYTPMQINLRRKEQFGIHLHNIEFRYSDQPGLSIAPGKTNDPFSIATGELEFSGFVLPGTLYFQVVIDPRDVLGKGLGDSIAGKIDPANTPSGIVRDAFGDLVIAEPQLIFRFGQQRIPFGIEAQTPGGLLPFIDRAYMDFKTAHNTGPENTGFGNAELIQERDIGFQIRGTLLHLPDLDYAVGLFNGSGINVNDTNNSKDWVGRVGFVPVPGLRFGLSGYNGTQTDLLKEEVPRNRIGGDFELNQDFIPKARFMGEWVDGPDGSFDRRTWYLSGFYELISQKLPGSPGLLFALRYEEMHDNDDYSRWTCGLTWYFLNAVNPVTGYWQQVKFQLNDEVRNHNIPPGGSASTDPLAENLLLAQMTVRY